MEVSHKKILYLVTKGNWGGAQRYVYDLATTLHAQGATVSVAYGNPGQLGQKLSAAGVRTIELPALGRDVSLFADINSYKQIARTIRAERPDILHLNSSKAGALGALAGRFARVPCIVFTAHGWAFNERRNTVARGIIWLVSWITALLSHRVIAVSDHELRAAQRMPFCARKAVRIYNGIDLKMQFGSGEIIRKSFPANVQITGTVGELTKNKNQIALVEEAHKNPDMYVAIVGEGELRTYLEQKIKAYGLEGRVKLFGFLPASEVMRGFDRFALPSIKEGLAYVILEARVAGLPIVANRVGGVGEAADTDLAEFSLEKMVEQTVALYRS
jgi:glycosyltransferase involved in cell wall biosynthesis